MLSKCASTFNCLGLVWYAFNRAGIDLAPSIRSIITPQDLADSPAVETICDPHWNLDGNSGNSSGGPGNNGGGATWPNHFSLLILRIVAVLRNRPSRASRTFARLVALLT